MEIAVISGKGGTGKSSITSAFIALAGQVVAVDCDVDASNLYLLLNPEKAGEEKFISGYHARINQNQCYQCGKCVTYCKFDALGWDGGSVAINEVACEGCFLCSRVCPAQAINMIPSDDSRLYWGDFRYGKMVYGRLAPGEENSGKLINKLRTKARETAKAYNLETIILDGPPGISCPVISTITGVDKVVIITEPTISGMSDLQRTVELVRKFDVGVYIIVNKYDLNTEISGDIDLWCAGQSLQVIGHFPFDKSMVDAMIAGESIIEYSSNAEISKLINVAYMKIIT